MKLTLKRKFLLLLALACYLGQAGAVVKTHEHTGEGRAPAPMHADDIAGFAGHMDADVQHQGHQGMAHHGNDHGAARASVAAPAPDCCQHQCDCSVGGCGFPALSSLSQGFTGLDLERQAFFYSVHYLSAPSLSFLKPPIYS